MTIRDVLLPLFVEVILTFALLFWMAYLRTRDFTGGAVRLRDVALRRAELAGAHHPDRQCVPQSARIADAVLRADHPGLDHPHAGTIFVALAWLFVLLRVIQAAVAVTDNNVRRRGPAFILGAIVLAIMWGNFMLDILVGI